MKFTRNKKVSVYRFYWAVWYPKGQVLEPSEMSHPQPVFIDDYGRIYHHSGAVISGEDWMIGDELDHPEFDPACPDFEEQ